MSVVLRVLMFVVEQLSKLFLKDSFDILKEFLKVIEYLNGDKEKGFGWDIVEDVSKEMKNSGDGVNVDYYYYYYYKDWYYCDSYYYNKE